VGSSAGAKTRDDLVKVKNIFAWVVCRDVLILQIVVMFAITHGYLILRASAAKPSAQLCEKPIPPNID